ncbi:cation efflux protein [Neocallimastix sp. 'constans']
MAVSSDISDVKVAFDSEGNLLNKDNYKCDSYDNNKTKSKKRLFLSLGCCFLFFLFELLFGLIAGSLALVSDSFHMLSDATGFIISIVAIYFSNRHATRAHSFGFHRVEIIGVLVSILLIWVVTVFLVIEAIDRLRNPIEINGKVMLFTAVIGIIMNILLFFILGDGHDGHGHAHGHVHGGHHHHHHAHEHESDDSDKEVDECHDDHSYDSKNLKQKIKNFDKNMNINVKSAFIHVLGDLLSSIGVLIAAIIICINKDLVFFDPICTFIFSVLIIITTFNLLHQSLSVIMESTPKEIDTESIIRDLLEIKGVEQVHDIHIWNLTVGKPSMIAHITFNVNPVEEPILCTFERILFEAQLIVCSNYHIHHTTIQLEPNKKSKDCHSHDHYNNLFTEHCEPEMCHIVKKNK